MGSKASGIEGHIRGWNVGARVYVSHNEKTGQDEVTVHLTSGSSGHKSSKLVGEYTIDDLD